MSCLGWYRVPLCSETNALVVDGVVDHTRLNLLPSREYSVFLCKPPAIQFPHDTFSWIFDHASLMNIVPLPVPICNVIHTVVRDSLCAPLFCEFRVNDRGLCSLPPLRTAGVKPERPCNLLGGHTRYPCVMELNCPAVGVTHRSRSPDAFCG